MIQKYGVLLWVALMGLGFNGLAHADGGPEWQCTPEYFVGDAGFSGSLFKAKMAVDCLIRGATGEGLKSLERHFYWGATKAPGVFVHLGPLKETYDGLPGMRFDITTNSRESDGSTVSIRQNVRLASDYQSLLIYHFDSTGIQATGDAERMRFLGVHMEFRPAGEPGAYKVLFQNTIYLDLPFFTRPVASLIREKTKDAFHKKVLTLIPTLMHKL